MDYTEYAYLYPPRPETKCPVGTLPFYQNRGWWAQTKKNGTCTVIFAKGDQVIFKTRHGEADEHKAWTPLAEHVKFFKDDSKGAWNVYCAELLHSKTPHIKNQLYIFDQLVEDGKLLEGTTFAERQLNLHARWAPTTDEGDQIRVHPLVSVAVNFTNGFAERFKNLKAEDEGLVLKDPKAILKVGYTSNNNTGWQAKCRIPHKNYGF